MSLFYSSKSFLLLSAHFHLLSHSRNLSLEALLNLVLHFFALSSLIHLVFDFWLHSYSICFFLSSCYFSEFIRLISFYCKVSFKQNAFSSIFSVSAFAFSTISLMCSSFQDSASFIFFINFACFSAIYSESFYLAFSSLILKIQRYYFLSSLISFWFKSAFYSLSWSFKNLSYGFWWT